MGGNGDRALISNAVVGSGGVAGIKINGNNIHVKIAEHENTSSVTPFDPTKLDAKNAVVGGFGVAGFDIQGSGIDFIIGHDKSETTTTTDGVKPNTNPADGVNPNTTTKEDVNPKTTTGAGVTPKPDTLPYLAQGPMCVTHVPGRSIAFSDNGFEIICAACAFEVGTHWFSDCKDVILQNIKKGLHVKGSTVLEQPNVKPLSPAVEAPFGIIPGKSIKIRDPPGNGFDIICPTCAVNLGMGGIDLLQNINAIFRGQHVHEKEVNTMTKEGINPDITTKEKVIQKVTLMVDYGKGPLHISHIQGQSLSEGEHKIVCPGCSYEHGRTYFHATLTFQFSSIINQGLHMNGLRILDQENVKPLRPPTLNKGCAVTSPNIRPRDPPSTGFDVICCGCAWGLAYNRDQVLAYNMIIQGQHVHTQI